MIGIVSTHHDLHARAVRHELQQSHGVACALIPVDTIAGSGAVSWRPDAPDEARVPVEGGAPIAVGELDAVWHRRPVRQQVLPDHLDPACQPMLDADCTESVLGALRTGMRGHWVSDPDRTTAACDKLLQLQVARALGFRIPRTLVSSDPAAIRRFVAGEPGGVIIKRAADSRLFFKTTRVSDELLAQDDALSAMPSMYQEAIEGTVHIRAHLFGERCLAAVLESQRLDWRIDLDVPWRIYDVDATTTARLRAFQRALGLDMGVYDLKLDASGEPVFLEINPQGQFLFVEGITGLRLTSALAEHLVIRARSRSADASAA